MLGGNQRIALHRHRGETVGWLGLLSLALHAAVFLALLTVSPSPFPTNASEPPSVDVVVQERPAEESPAPADAAPEASAEAPAAPIQQAETPPPVPAPPPDPPPDPPPVQQAETPPPAPAPLPDPPPPLQQAELPLPPPPPPPPPPPDVPPPVQRAELPPPVPKPAPPSPPVERPRPPAAPRVAARPVPARAAPAPARAPGGQEAASRPSDANNGAVWMGKLKQWWDLRSFYPKEASQTNEGGAVKVRIGIAADGRVTSIDVVQGSGSTVLDQAALAVFRNGRLPPFPPGTPLQPADVVVTLRYRPAENGG